MFSKYYMEYKQKYIHYYKQKYFPYYLWFMP